MDGLFEFEFPFFTLPPFPPQSIGLCPIRRPTLSVAHRHLSSLPKVRFFALCQFDPNAVGFPLLNHYRTINKWQILPFRMQFTKILQRFSPLEFDRLPRLLPPLTEDGRKRRCATVSAIFARKIDKKAKIASESEPVARASMSEAESRMPKCRNTTLTVFEKG